MGLRELLDSEVKDMHSNAQNQVEGKSLIQRVYEALIRSQQSNPRVSVKVLYPIEIEGKIVEVVGEIMTVQLRWQHGDQSGVTQVPMDQVEVLGFTAVQ
jgi:ribosomal protein L18E